MDRLSKRILRCIAILAVLGLMTHDSLYISKANEMQNKGIAANSNQEEAEVVNEIETVIEEVVPPCTEEVIYGDMTEETYIVQTSYDKSIFVENGLEFHYIAGDTWQGLMTIVKDPSRVFVGIRKSQATERKTRISLQLQWTKARIYGNRMQWCRCFLYGMASSLAESIFIFGWQEEIRRNRYCQALSSNFMQVRLLSQGKSCSRKK